MAGVYDIRQQWSFVETREIGAVVIPTASSAGSQAASGIERMLTQGTGYDEDLILEWSFRSERKSREVCRHLQLLARSTGCTPLPIHYRDSAKL